MPRVQEDPAPEGDAAHLARLRALLDLADRSGVSALSEESLLLLPRLYRYAASCAARHDTAGIARGEVEELLARAHARLHGGAERPLEGALSRFLDFFLGQVPRAIRGEWKVIAASFGLTYGIAILSFFAVRRDLDLAWSLMSPEMVSQEIAQLEKTAQGEPFRGNFTFGIGRSPETSAWIMTHNMSVGILFFAFGLVPPVFLILLGVNGLMLGTYTAVASHWGQALSISSILWCHGVLEIQAIVLAGAAGLVLVRAWIAPGPWSRRRAMSLESRRALRLLAPVFPMLFVAGLIEGFVSPHAPLGVRVAVAALSAAAIASWIAFGGREPRPAGA
jgi:uncharacterized membrane protein SpoIIM required for sporulation